MIKEIVLNHLSGAINRLLNTDPLAFDALKNLNGKVLLIQCLPLQTPIYLIITAHGVQLKTVHEGTVSVSITGKASALLRFAKSPDQTKMLMDEQVSLHGEIDLLLKLKQLAARTELDIEGLLANYVGDTVAIRLSQMTQGLLKKTRGSLHSLSKSTTLYLQEEKQLLPDALEVEQFVVGVNQLRQDLERVQARVDRLNRGMKSC